MRRLVIIVVVAALALLGIAAVPAGATVNNSVVLDPWGYWHAIKALPNGVIHQWWYHTVTFAAAHDVLKPTNSFGTFEAGECDAIFEWHPDAYWVPWFPAHSYWVCRVNIDPEAAMAKMG